MCLPEMVNRTSKPLQSAKVRTILAAGNAVAAADCKALANNVFGKTHKRIKADRPEGPGQRHQLRPRDRGEVPALPTNLQTAYRRQPQIIDDSCRRTKRHEFRPEGHNVRTDRRETLSFPLKSEACQRRNINVAPAKIEAFSSLKGSFHLISSFPCELPYGGFLHRTR